MGLPEQGGTEHRVQWKVWGFRLVAVVLVPALFFGLLEGGLRVLGYGFSPDFFVQIEGRDAVTTNQKFGRRFFPPAVARVPEACVLPAEKGADTYRIFILGGSAALGTPDAAFGFGRILEAMLKERYAGVRFEVVNAAMTAVNSHVVLPIARDCAERGADLFVVYMGNNEVVGPYGAGTVFQGFSPSLAAIRAGIRLRSFRTGQLLEGLLQRLARGGGDLTEWQGMKMFLDHRVPAHDPRLEGVYSHFRQNLTDICGAAIRAGAKTIVCTVGTNLKDNPPFASVHREGMTGAERSGWEDLYRAGVRLAEEGRYGRAVEQFLEASGLDDRFAELHFRLGRCYGALGQFDRARERFVRARDLDALRFRADTGINRTIREVAGGREAQGIYLVDAERAFERSAPHGIPGGELFYEHVHPRFEGNYELARAVFQKVTAILPPRFRAPALSPVLPPSRERCAERLALTDWNRAQSYSDISEMMDAPPFTDQFDSAQRRDLREKKLREFKREDTVAFSEAYRVYREAVEGAPDDLYFRMTFASLLQVRQDDAGAAEQWRLLLSRVPNRAGWHEWLGHVLSEAGKQGEAIEHYRLAMQILPGLVRPHIWIGTALAKQGRFDEAAASFRRALQISPGSVAAHRKLGDLLEEAGRPGEAEATFARGLEIAQAKGDRRAEGEFLGDIARVHFRQGELEAALGGYRRALEIAGEGRNPSGEAGLLGNIGNVYFSQGKKDASLDSHRRALEIYTEIEDAFGRANALFDIGGVTFSQGRLEDALASFEAALELYRQVGDNPGQAHALGSIGNVHFRKEDLEGVLRVNREALEVYERMNDPAGRSRILTRIGNVYLKQGKPAEALIYHAQAFEVQKRSGHALGQADALANMGIGFANQGKHQEALDVMRQARRIYQRIGAREGLQAVEEMIAELQ